MHLSNERQAKAVMKTESHQQAEATTNLINKIIEENPTASIVFEVGPDHKLISCLGFDSKGKVVTNKSPQFLEDNPDRYIVHIAEEGEMTLHTKKMSTGEGFLYLVAGMIIGLVTTYAIIR